MTEDGALALFLCSIVGAIVLLLVLFWGDPDIHDALIVLLQK